jgi:PilZ domain
VTKSGDKSRRLRERIKLALPVRVRCRESAEIEWEEVSRLLDVTPFGARFMLKHPTERGRLLQLTMPMPRQLRCFDHVEDQYRVWALVRNMIPRPQFDAGGDGPSLRFEVGTAFVGKRPPASYLKEPATLYDIESLSPENNLWQVSEVKETGAVGVRSEKTRLQVAVNVSVEVFDDEGRLGATEQTVTENISRRGAAVWTTLQVERGRFVRLTNLETGLALVAVVRATRAGADGIPRLHLEFIGEEWPLEGIE